MFIYAFFVVPQNADDFNKLSKNNKYSSEKVKKRLFQTGNSKISNNMENSAKNTIGSSFLSKFDAINSFPSSAPNKIQPSIYKFNQVHPYLYKSSQETRKTQGKHLVNKGNTSVHRNNDKENFNFIPQSNGENNYTDFIKKNMRSFETNKENSSMLTNESIDETFQDFKPPFTSSPLQMDGINVFKSDRGNKSIFKIPAYPKRFADECHGQLLTSNSEGQIMCKNKAQSECEETIKSTASSRVRQLVKQIIGSQKKLQSINGNDNKNIVFYLTPEGTRAFNKSQFEKGNKIENDSHDNDENSNKIVGFKISVEHNNNKSTVREESELQKTISDTSISSCVSVGSQTEFENPDPGFSGSDNVSIKSNKSNSMNPNSKNIIKRLKIGVSLYGCDFQVIKVNILHATFNFTIFKSHKYFIEYQNEYDIRLSQRETK